ncbi:bifunctional adenosylcobinamide kinase/adenosylcobinamide-phosphate guanylyltransferase [Ramlibacter monticola]|uniref:Bifunctional adenosylcobalamin biosynthesis protein n=1 Tax=Ramlibacter monticola TaxID=1926872 RepID=A0A936Z4W7_9BURK|nr:bifunctional adenosylcobinamide kinase/adenosylcobinamide-phosphate guanylyltransferase [Ramlibacter monticola]MBL0393745.1 bifunctional adenosylcobinamide kinase/adenosylcobinamide-phosphate guanylyltransferase [Ramlibacter monticola]
MDDLRVARSELILGGQKSGKTSRAEALAAAWLAQSAAHRAVYIATAQAWGEEMRARIERHRQDRARRVPAMETVEEPQDIVRAIAAHSRPGTLVVVDCLTLWLTARMMPPPGNVALPAPEEELMAHAVAAAAGPLVLVSNEIGLGVVPMGRETRAFVDALGRLNQQGARACERVTLMVAGLPVPVKGHP